METQEIVGKIETSLKDIGSKLDRNNVDVAKVSEQFKSFQTNLDAQKAGLEKLELETRENAKALSELRRANVQGLAGHAEDDYELTAGRLSRNCAKWIGAACVSMANGVGRLGSQDTPHDVRERTLTAAQKILGEVITRATLTTSDVPMPVNYASQIVQLVLRYGQFRNYATVFPLPGLTLNKPKLTTSPAFGFINAAAAVSEKSPQFANVTFTSKKAGGLVRFPTEIEEDSIVSLGEWLGDYIAREFSKWEDTVGFLADGSGTYLSLKGVGKAADDLTKRVVLTAGNTAPSNITLANLRTLRTVVDAATYPSAAYYMHPTMEVLLNSFNGSTNGTVFINNGINGATLDGFPVRWINVMPVYGTAATVNAYQVYYGDMKFWHMGTRSAPTIARSAEVYFTTDEIALRALERFDIQLMADSATGVLKLAAS